MIDAKDTTRSYSGLGFKEQTSKDHIRLPWQWAGCTSRLPLLQSWPLNQHGAYMSLLYCITKLIQNHVFE